MAEQPQHGRADARTAVVHGLNDMIAWNLGDRQIVLPTRHFPRHRSEVLLLPDPHPSDQLLLCGRFAVAGGVRANGEPERQVQLLHGVREQGLDAGLRLGGNMCGAPAYARLHRPLHAEDGLIL